MRMRIAQRRMELALPALLVLVALGGCNRSKSSPNSTASNPSTATNATQPAPPAPAMPPPQAPAPAASAAPSKSQASPGAALAATTQAQSQASPPAAPAPPSPPPIIIPAGTILTATLDQDISTKTNSTGDRFAASLAEPVHVNGARVLAVGTKLRGTITQAQAAGRVKGGAALTLQLDGLTLKGDRYAIQTVEYEQAGNGRGKRTAVGGGAGAAFGAIVGALAGGGKGAAIGALAGGGAGTAGAAFTGKRDITLPAETTLHFKLKHSLTLPGE